MATSSALLSIDDYLRTSYRPDADYVDGEIDQRNLGEYEHAKLQSLINFLFTSNEDVWKTDAVVEQRIRVAPRRVRIADVAILRADAPHEHVTATAPLICIEVMSPEDRISRVTIRLADYLAMGVPNIWLIDFNLRSGHTFDASGLHVVDKLFTVPGTPSHLDMEDLFRKLDQKIAAHKAL